MVPHADVIVVGGGFAGITAARELQRSGLQTLVLEARDRVGGRVWTAEFGDVPVEMGGSWIHWHQAHVWSELTRYGLDVVESGVWSGKERRVHVVSGLDVTGRSTVERVGWLVDGKLRVDSPEVAFGLLNEGVRQVCDGAYDLLPRPHDIFHGDISEIEQFSIRDRLDKVGLTGDVAAMTEAILATICSAHLEETGLLALLRWYALSGYEPQLLWDCEERYKVRTGMRSLVESIANDGGAELRLSTPVSAIEHTADAVAVTTRDGERLTARAVVVTVPVNVLESIEFSPQLSDGKRAVAREKQSTHGVKAWIRVRGEHAYVGAAPSRYPFSYLVSEFHVDGDTMFFAFGSDADAIDVLDKRAVAEAVRGLLPEAEVIDSHAHDWAHDEFTRGTWSMPRPGQAMAYLKELQRPEGRLFLAGSDVASGWHGFIDGAIESGLAVARKVVGSLAG